MELPPTAILCPQPWRAELLAEAGQDGSDGNLGGRSDTEEEGADEEGGLSDLDYDAMLAANGKGEDGSSSGEEKEDEGGSSDGELGGSGSSGEEEGDDGGVVAVQLGSGKRRRMGNAEARAAVEDEHFKLDEMEAFLQQV